MNKRFNDIYTQAKKVDGMSGLNSAQFVCERYGMMRSARKCKAVKIIISESGYMPTTLMPYRDLLLREIAAALVIQQEIEHEDAKLLTDLWQCKEINLPRRKNVR